MYYWLFYVNCHPIFFSFGVFACRKLFLTQIRSLFTVGLAFSKSIFYIWSHSMSKSVLFNNCWHFVLFAKLHLKCVSAAILGELKWMMIWNFNILQLIILIFPYSEAT